MALVRASAESTDPGSGNRVEIRISGQLEKSDYTEIVPWLEERIREHGRIDLLVVLEDFEGWTAGGLWEDIKFDLRHFRDFRRVALVGDEKWEKRWEKFSEPFTTTRIGYFPPDQLDEARRWIRGEDPPPEEDVG